ncbi:hypothetical protein BGZ65_002300 [Modicella reniformis]|uniref:Wings apart-like protein C-terminal domain-containing protein n=1 Tax=Modicella reniformis TaxID=1440133 RepID=A0A9P6IL75_9FUNG|nr:hypothetical protein BGZ65_002300 [Modicella reniformis]
MPLAPRRNAASKPRHTYGRQRNFLDQDEGTVDTGDFNDQPPRPNTLSPLKRMNTDLGSPVAFKRISSRSSYWPMLSGTNLLQGSNDYGASTASHELRETGQSHRFKDEIEDVLDGIRSKDKSRVRRISCLDLVRSMLEPEFAAQVRSHQYMPAIFETIHDDRDPDPKTFRDLMTIHGLIPFLCKNVEMDIDPLAMIPSVRQEMTLNPNHGMLQFNDLKDLARRSGIIQKGQKVLVKSMALVNMAGIVNEGVSLQDADTLSKIEQDPKFLCSVIEILIEDLAWIKQPSSELGISLPDVLDIDRIENCISILERTTLISKRAATKLADNTRLFPLLVQLVTLCRAHAFQYPQRTDSLNLMLHVLRLLVNVTNGFESCCTVLTNSGSIQVLVQNFVQFYHHCRNYNPEDLGMEPHLFSGSQPKQWTKAASRSDSGLSFDMSSQGAACTDSTSASDGEEDPLYQSHVGQTVTGNLNSIREVKIDNDANGWYRIGLQGNRLLIKFWQPTWLY